MTHFIDTHNHLYLEQFDQDRDMAVERALRAGVKYMLLPNVDEETTGPMLQLHEKYPQNCLPMMGLHPTSVKPGFEKILETMKARFRVMKFFAVGETGIDLYWDKTHFDLQVQSFRTQIEWALEFNLPLVIHSRNSVTEIMDVLDQYRGTNLKGVMHCFPGDTQQARWFTDFGFWLGIGGVVTYKKSAMAEVVKNTPLDKIILETDAPYLPPVPHRGKRNEPAYIPLIANKIAEIKGISREMVAEETTKAAHSLFKID
ncbi:MAG: TatD family deoxyribonuclease [Bacteroidetes bacterium]|nr:MAG: TatD family deoxyribonuclease [Bacteroidota bacterium]